MSLPVALDAASIEAIALRVVELLAEREDDSRGVAPGRLVDAAALARLLSVSRSTVYEHAEQLGGVRIGAGDRPRLRFDVARARRAWSVRVSGEKSHLEKIPAPAEVRRRRRQSKSGSGARLLPVKGQEAA